ncbi:calsenilin isoform X6 [Macaca fascicularis]|uniref:calsenilin isoform X6 n=1 Tax=Macaca fascicularis TaxID=9541 RepID=UPI003D15E97F
MQPAKLFGQAHGGVPRRSSSALPEWLMTEVTKASDGSLLGDLGHTPLSKKEGVKWQRPRLSRQALMRCCLVKWILSSTAPQGSGAGAHLCPQLVLVLILRGHHRRPHLPGEELEAKRGTGLSVHPFVHPSVQRTA